MSIKISVIVPVYNVELYLEKCIESICNQTYKNLQIILVDDGSTDSSGNICDLYGKKDNRITVIHKTNGGLSDARNAGLDIADGEYIGFVDSDDYIAPEMFEHLLNLSNRNNGDIVICDKVEFNENETISVNNKLEQINVLDRDVAIAQLASDTTIRSHVWNKLYKHNLFDGIRFDVGKAYEDVYIMHRLFLKTQKIVITNQVFYYYLQRSNSILGEMNLNKQVDLYWAYVRRYEELIGQFYTLKKDLIYPIYFCLWELIKKSHLKDKYLLKICYEYYKRNIDCYYGKRDILLKKSLILAILLFN